MARNAGNHIDGAVKDRSQFKGPNGNTLNVIPQQAALWIKKHPGESLKVFVRKSNIRRHLLK